MPRESVVHPPFPGVHLSFRPHLAPYNPVAGRLDRPNGLFRARKMRPRVAPSNGHGVVDDIPPSRPSQSPGDPDRALKREQVEHHNRVKRARSKPFGQPDPEFAPRPDTSHRRQPAAAQHKGLKRIDPKHAAPRRAGNRHGHRTFAASKVQDPMPLSDPRFLEPPRDQPGRTPERIERAKKSLHKPRGFHRYVKRPCRQPRPTSLCRTRPLDHSSLPLIPVPIFQVSVWQAELRPSGGRRVGWGWRGLERFMALSFGVGRRLVLARRLPREWG